MKTTDEPDKRRGSATTRGRAAGTPSRGSRVLPARGRVGLTDEASALYRLTLFGRPFLVVIARNDTPNRKYSPKSSNRNGRKRPQNQPAPVKTDGQNKEKTNE